MPASNFTFFNSFFQAIGRKVHNLHTDTLKIKLTNTQPNAASHSVASDITEITPQNGYSAGGYTVGSHSFSQTGGVAKLIIDVDPSMAASGGSVGPFQWPVLYNDTAAGDELIGYWAYPATTTLLDGEPLLIDIDQANGLFSFGV